MEKSRENFTNDSYREDIVSAREGEKAKEREKARERVREVKEKMEIDGGVAKKIKQMRG